MVSTDNQESHAEALAVFDEYSAAAERLYKYTFEHRQKTGRLPKPAAGDPRAESPEEVAFGVAMCAIENGFVCPAWAAKAVAAAWKQFEDYEVASLGAAFGIPNHTNLKAKRDEQLCAVVYSRVRELQVKKRLPLTDGRQGKGALSIVADEMSLRKHSMGPKKVEALCTRWRKLCKETGHDPDERPKYADPISMIAAAIAQAIAPTQPKKNTSKKG
ncbi:MAG: hypothetical protein QM741_13225 [Rudaea sp.]|uniref:hypothetical protein n=1 Tax=Rudaea sp. TaxID=2136325 RepID=UPI0039E55502